MTTESRKKCESPFLSAFENGWILEGKIISECVEEYLSDEDSAPFVVSYLSMDKWSLPQLSNIAMTTSKQHLDSSKQIDYYVNFNNKLHEEFINESLIRLKSDFNFYELVLSMVTLFENYRHRNNKFIPDVFTWK